MKVNNFSISYFAGVILITLSGFFPYLRYKFTMVGADDVKRNFPMLRLGLLADQYRSLGEVGIIIKILGYLILIAGIAGIVIVWIYFSGDRNTWNIFNVNMIFPPVAAAIFLFIIEHNKVISNIKDILDSTVDNMTNSGYSGSAGHGIGFYMLVIGIIVSTVSAVCFFALDKSD